MGLNYAALTGLFGIDINVTWVYTHAYTISPLQGFSGTFQHTEFFYYYSTEKTQGYCYSASLRFIIPSFSTLPLNITPVRRIDKDLQQVAFN